ncbi:MAG: hypothetical protein KC613_01030 [Myxococcales bacterium]|nr:hypothetical protein [Myxococcales bacterium]
MITRVTLTTLALAASLSLPALAQVPTAGLDQAKATVEGWFMGYEFVPGPAQYKAVGPALEPALVSLALDASKHPLVRARAVSAMVNAKGALTEQALVGLLEDPAADSMLRRKAARALAEGWGDQHLSVLVNAFLLAPDDVALREGIAKAIRGLGPAGYEARDTLLRLEKDRFVRGLLLEAKSIK